MQEISFLYAQHVIIFMQLVKEGEGRIAVILAHGYGYDMSEWGDFFIVLSKALQEQGFCVYKFNFQQTTTSHEIRQLEKVVKKVRPGHEKVFVVGMSTGALVAILEKEPVDFKVLLFPPIYSKRSFQKLLETGHHVSDEWMKDCERYDLRGRRFDKCFMFYSDTDEYITKKEYESIGCEKALLEGWEHGPANEHQMRELSEMVTKKLTPLR